MTYPANSLIAHAVRADVKGRATPQELRLMDSLRTAAGLAQWYRELVAAKTEVELQISQNKASLHTLRAKGLIEDRPNGKERYLEELGKVSDWKIGAIRYLRAIEQKICHVKQLATELSESTGKPPDELLGRR